MKVVLVSGTPGTGKTSIAKYVAEKLNYEYVHIGEEEEYVCGEEEGVKVIDINKMIKWLIKKQELSKKTLIIDSHLSHYFPAERTRICIITRCDPAELKIRLMKRHYSKRKIEINLEAEAMDLILQEALENGHRVYEIDTTNKSVEISGEEVIDAIKNNKVKYGNIDFTYYLMQ